MAQFLNQDASPGIKDSAKQDTLIEVQQPQATVNWGDATDLGASALERASNTAQARTAAITAGQSFIAGAGNSIIAAGLRKAFSPDFPTDLDFNSTEMLQKDARTRIYTPNQEEIDYLRTSVSLDDYNYRIEQMLEQRERDTTASANIVSGIAGSILGDAPTLLAPFAAAGVAGRAGLAVRSAIRAADVGSAYYAQDQLGQSEGITALVAAVSGVDQLFDIRKAVNASRAVQRTVAGATEDAADTAANNAVDASTGTTRGSTRTEMQFDEAAPTKRTAPDSDAFTTKIDSLESTPLKKPIRILKGQQARVSVRASDVTKNLLARDVLDEGQKALLRSLDGIIDDVPVHLVGDTSISSRYNLANNAVTLRASKKGPRTWKTYGDAINGLDSNTAKIAVHELIHAATVRAIQSGTPEALEATTNLTRIREQLLTSPNLDARMRYSLSSNEELLAGLADDKGLVKLLRNTEVEGASAIRRIAQTILKALGAKVEGNALNSVLDSYDALLDVAAKERGVTRYKSQALSEYGEFADTANGAVKQLDSFKKAFARSFSLYDNIAEGSKDLADLLVADGAAVGARRPSVADYKRNLQLELDGAASVVEKAIIDSLRADGIGLLDAFLQRNKFKAARRERESKLAQYLDQAYSAETAGREIPTPPQDIAPLVKAYVDSEWATKWYDHLQKSGLVEVDSQIKRSPYYFPRSYSYDAIRQQINTGARQASDYRDLFRQALRDIYPDMTTEVAGRVAREMFESIYDGKSKQTGPAWRSILGGVGNEVIVDAMRAAGVADDQIRNFLTTNVAREATQTSRVKNLRTRNRFDLQKEYVVNGQAMRMADILDTDVAKQMQGYTNRVSGRVAFAYAGVTDLNALEGMINTAKSTVRDPDRYQKHVDDTIDFMVGAPVQGSEVPEIFRAAGNLANATVLKNSGLYQLADTALAMKEFGMTRVLRSMKKEKWWKEATAVAKDASQSARLDSILRGSIQKELRFRWLNSYADDNLDLTRSSRWFNITQNIGQAARHVNGMGLVHRLQTNVNAGIVMDELKLMLNGDAEATKRLQRWGLDPELAKRMQAAASPDVDALLPDDLQLQLEIIGTRLMDHVIQQIRVGETSHFAQFSPVGRVVVGYGSFAVAGTNKILRREYRDNGWIGLAHLAAYQFPLMYLITQARFAADGKQESEGKLIAEAVKAMSILGGFSFVTDIFSDQSPRHSLTATGYAMNILGLIQKVAAGEADLKDVSRSLPLLQEFMPTRAIINNFGD